MSVIRTPERSAVPRNAPLVIVPYTSALLGFTDDGTSVSDDVDERPSAHANCASPCAPSKRRAPHVAPVNRNVALNFPSPPAPWQRSTRPCAEII